MMNALKPRLSLLSFLAVATLVACDDSTDPQVPNEVEVTPASVTLDEIGATEELTATVLDEDGDPITGLTVTWSSDDEDVATVGTDGVVTAVDEGTATITATLDDLSDEVAVEVSLGG